MTDSKRNPTYLQSLGRIRRVIDEASFNGSFRAECLNASWFLSLADARSKCEAWRSQYNEVRPHSSIGQKTPVEWAKSSGQACLS